LRNRKRFRNGDLATVAEDARRLIADLAPLIEHLNLPKTKRTGTAITLLFASFCHAESICTLLRFENPNYGASAFALFRAQTEQFLRGAFFLDHASDDEIDYYRKNDQLKKRDGDKVTVRVLANLVQPTLLPDAPDDKKFAGSVMTMWEPLCGFVHGGTDLLNMYNRSQEIGPNLEPMRAFVIIRKAVSLCFLAMVLISRRGDQNSNDFTRPFTTAFQRFSGIAASIDEYGPWNG